MFNCLHSADCSLLSPNHVYLILNTYLATPRNFRVCTYFNCSLILFKRGKKFPILCCEGFDMFRRKTAWSGILYSIRRYWLKGKEIINSKIKIISENSFYGLFLNISKSIFFYSLDFKLPQNKATAYFHFFFFLWIPSNGVFSKQNFLYKKRLLKKFGWISL